MNRSTRNVFSWGIAGLIGAWFLCGAVLAGILIDAVLLHVLWGWFVVPTFGLAALSIPVAGGLVTIAYVLRGTTHAPSKKKRDEEDSDPKDEAVAMRRSLESLRTSLFALVMRPILILSAGWILKVFM